MSAPERVEVDATAVAAGGGAIGRLPNGKVVFVEGALPGERVLVEVREERRDFARATCVEVLVAAAERITPPCQHLLQGCGGCDWQHVAPGAQVGLKATIVTDALRRIARLGEPPPPAGPRAVPPDAYRTTVRLGVDGDGRPGYRRRRGHELVPPERCLVAHPRLDELIGECRFAGATEVLLRVGVAGGERIAALSGGEPARSVVPSDVVVVERSHPEPGAVVREDVGGRRWRVSAGSFFQSGPAAASLLADAVHDAVGGALGPGDTLLDAYAGVGVLGGIVAERRGAHLVSVEQHPEAVADARVNLADLPARVVASAVGELGPGLAADVVVADPARPGLGRPGVDALGALGASRIVLVSCDPGSFARDTALLAGAGYRLARWGVVDLFPQTSHVETVARFDR